ncbi:SpoIIE family protein phosphatase [Halotalea alkalilenta]|uniref:SpoIIE family protein phosphatase n=1 Tax=Halotalea alkalilenta TaxID=376489 RepID=UPI0004877CD4|nr:SpoIIE family protein phosphatase [Halotalea alkalilenta]
MTTALGLRIKLILVLLGGCLLALVPALIIGALVIDKIRDQLSVDYARTQTQLIAQRVGARIAERRQLARQLAAQPATSAWLSAENPASANAFVADATRLANDFDADMVFAYRIADRHFYLLDSSPSADLISPLYQANPLDTEDAWLFGLLDTSTDQRIQVIFDAHLERQMIWISVPVFHLGRPVGEVGSGIELPGFIEEMLRERRPGITPMLIDPQGNLRAHPDASLVADRINPGYFDFSRNLYSLVTPEQRGLLSSAIIEARRYPGSQVVRALNLQSRDQLISVQSLPELNWLMVSAVAPQELSDADAPWFAYLSLATLSILAMLLIMLGWLADRLLLNPLRLLTASAQSIARGEFRTNAPLKRRDELGQLSQAFAQMAERIRNHTSDLERTVSERTQALEHANEEMRRAHRTLDESIGYARLLQSAILPARLEQRVNGAVLWRPRDRVGGDFYLLHEEPGGCLVGIIDCAGHGVPGAMMTMLARGLLDRAILLAGGADPASVLTETDRLVRLLLDERRGLATEMDVALLWLDANGRSARFAGAKLDLFLECDGQVIRHRGGRRPLGHRRRGEYANVELSFPSKARCYMTSDGLLDQAGGEDSFGFGVNRFIALLEQASALPLPQSLSHCAGAIDDYRAGLAQRDDITLLVIESGDFSPR